LAYLVDSDILIDLSRGSLSASEYVDNLGEWSVSIVTGMELVAGAKDKGEVQEIELMLSSYRTIALSEEVGQLAYNLMK
jgi:predicted nucleic acid-binding protein